MDRQTHTHTCDDNTPWPRGKKHTMYVHEGTTEQTTQDVHQETLDAAGNKGQLIKKVTKVNEH